MIIWYNFQNILIYISYLKSIKIFYFIFSVSIYYLLYIMKLSKMHHKRQPYIHSIGKCTYIELYKL